MREKIRITARPRQQPRPDELAERAAEPAARVRSRIEQALLCPYCRDTVRGDDVLLCQRRGCGAVYHRECWEECRASYGACAIYGCESTASDEVSRWGYVLRFLRLLLTALLFPPRMARAIRDNEGRAFRGVYEQSLGLARRVYRASNKDGDTQSVLTLFLGIPLSYGLLYLISGFSGAFVEAHLGLVMICLLFGPFLMLILPFIFAFILTLGFYSLKAVARIMSGELAALGRGDGDTVLARLRGGGGKK